MKRNLKPVAAQEPEIESFVQTVPDHCDRIVWKGTYIHLPIANAAPCARCAELDSTFGQVIADAAKELGCDPDNEAILESIFALSTNSPFWEGRLTGYKSYRTTSNLLQEQLQWQTKKHHFLSEYSWLT